MKLLAFDIESCTGRHDDASMCEFGWYGCDEKFECSTQENILINPKPEKFIFGRKDNNKGVQLQYEESEYREQASFDAYYDQVKALFGDDTLVVGFDIVHDLRYLNDACRQYNKQIINFKFLEAKLFYNLTTDRRSEIGLKTLSDKYSIEYTMHRADEDARATLLSLKGILKELGVNILEAIDRYRIEVGENGSAIKPCLSKSLIQRDTEQMSLDKRGSILINNFYSEYKPNTDKSKSPYNKKYIALNSDIRANDTLLARRAIGRIVDFGGYYCTDYNSADIFVYNKDDAKSLKTLEANKQRKYIKTFKTIEQQEFLRSLGELPQLTLDDDKIIFDYLLSKEQDRYNPRKKTTTNYQEAQSNISIGELIKLKLQS